MKKYLIYKTTNLITGKYYIGAHETDNLNDNYLGSGSVLKKALKKYGRENFKREILKECNSREEMYSEEQSIIKIHYKEDNCYNVKHGGVGGWDYVNSNGLLVGENNPMKRADIKTKCGLSISKTKTKSKKYKEIALINLEKAIEQNTGKQRPEHSKFMKEWSKQYWETNKEKQRDCLSSWFLVTDPHGKEYKTNRLEDFCLTQGLPYTTIWKSSTTNIPIKKGKAKGWACLKL